MDAYNKLMWPRDHQLEAWERDPRQIQMAILEELTLLRKATERIATGLEAGISGTLTHTFGLAPKEA